MFYLANVNSDSVLSGGLPRSQLCCTIGVANLPCPVLNFVVVSGFCDGVLFFNNLTLDLFNSERYYSSIKPRFKGKEDAVKPVNSFIVAMVAIATIAHAFMGNLIPGILGIISVAILFYVYFVKARQLQDVGEMYFQVLCRGGWLTMLVALVTGMTSIVWGTFSALGRILAHL
ncbi:MAG: hypothetical protein Q8N56_01605 [bacterium]|nr:hypothetical protein [bacterium]